MLTQMITEIKYNTNFHKAPGYAMITGEMLKKLLTKGLAKFIDIINAALFKVCINVTEMTIVPKQAKSPSKMSFCQPVPLLLIMTKFRKSVIQVAENSSGQNEIIPDHWFGF